MAWWQQSWRADPRARRLADRHYNRQSPGATQFAPAGSCVVFRHADDAVWCTSWPEFAQHAWAGAWVNSLFRNESDRLSSAAITEAVSHTLAHYGEPPELGMVTFVDAEKVRPKRDPGYCYLKAGFAHVGFTKGGLLAFQLLPAQMPVPAPADPVQASLFAEVFA